MTDNQGESERIRAYSNADALIIGASVGSVAWVGSQRAAEVAVGEERIVEIREQKTSENFDESSLLISLPLVGSMVLALVSYRWASRYKR